MADRELVDPSEPINPVSIEVTIRTVSNEIARGVKIVSGRLAVFRAAQTAYDNAFSRAYMAHEGPQQEKRQAAELATHKLREERDVAEVAYRHAEKAMSALEKELSAWQTINKTVAQMYGAAGHQGQGG